MLLAGHDRGAVFRDGDAAGTAQVVQADLVEGHGTVFADHGATGEDGDISQCGLASLAEGGCANGCNLKNAAVLVHHKSGQGFAFHFLGQYDEG